MYYAYAVYEFNTSCVAVTNDATEMPSNPIYRTPPMVVNFAHFPAQLRPSTQGIQTPSSVTFPLGRQSFENLLVCPVDDLPAFCALVDHQSVPINPPE